MSMTYQSVVGWLGMSLVSALQQLWRVQQRALDIARNMLMTCDITSRLLSSPCWRGTSRALRSDVLRFFFSFFFLLSGTTLKSGVWAFLISLIQNGSPRVFVTYILTSLKRQLLYLTRLIS